MRYVESFMLGLLIACTALFLQVFLSVFTEIFGYTLDLSHAATNGFMSVFLFFLIVAVIEELLRYIIIKKRVITYAQNSLSSILVHGTLIGCGFWIFEVVLALNKSIMPAHFYISMVFVLLIHVAASVLFIFFLKKNTSTHDSLIIGAAALIHTISNTLLFSITL